MHVRRAEASDELLQHAQVALEAAVRADRSKPRAWIVPRPVDVERADDRFRIFLGITRPTNITLVHPSSKADEEEGTGRAIEVAEIRDHRQDPGAWEPELFELRAVIL